MHDMIKHYMLEVERHYYEVIINPYESIDNTNECQK